MTEVHAPEQEDLFKRLLMHKLDRGMRWERGERQTPCSRCVAPFVVPPATYLSAAGKRECGRDRGGEEGRRERKAEREKAFGYYCAPPLSRSAIVRSALAKISVVRLVLWLLPCPSLRRATVLLIRSNIGPTDRAAASPAAGLGRRRHLGS